MELILLFAFAAVFALGLNYVGPRATTYFPTLAGSFWGSTLLTTIAVMVLLVAVSFAFAAAGLEKAKNA